MTNVPTSQVLSPRRLLLAGSVFAILLLTLQAACLWLLPGLGIPTCNLNDILALVSSLAATAGLSYGASWSGRLDRRLGQAWRLFALGMLTWAIGDGLWAYFVFRHGEAPRASLADFFYLATYPLLLLGIVRFPSIEKKEKPSLWTWVDILIVSFAALGIYWNFLLGPILLNGQPRTDWLTTFLNLSYPIADILLLSGLAYLLFMPRFSAWPNSLGLLLLGQSCVALADSLFAFHTLRGEFSTADSFHMLYSLSPLLMLLSGLSQAELVQRRLAGKEMPREPEMLYLLRLLTPFFWLTFAYFLLHVGGSQVHVLMYEENWVWVAGLLTIVALRQVAAAIHNRKLENELRNTNLTLEMRIAERSAELLRVNAELRQQMEAQRRIQALLREREERLAHSATHDSLTGLPNRSLLLDRLSQAMRRYRRHPDQGYALLFLDLDNFKTVNDSLGHLAGDELLIQVGRQLKSIVRAEDTLARISGDEFVLLLEQCHGEGQAARVAQRILDVLRSPFMVNDQSLYINASIGIVLAHPEYEKETDLLRDADLAMYEAKARGKGQFAFFAPELRLQANRRLALDIDLRQALETNAFVLHYQPILSLKDGRAVGFEALLRWRHPTRGLVGPAEFLPVAEANGFIHTLTEWTLREACRQIQAWQHLSTEHPLFISVNIASSALHQTELFHWIDASLRSFSLPPTCLRLEIVETASLHEDNADCALEQMHQRGIAVSLDDFGAGFSSLSSIHKYSFDVLKIDRSFVARLTQAEKLDTVVRAIIALSKELGIQTIAEGIETYQQLKFLQDAGCPFGQGFLLSPPLEATEAQALLERGGVIPLPTS